MINEVKTFRTGKVRTGIQHEIKSVDGRTLTFKAIFVPHKYSASQFMIQWKVRSAHVAGNSEKVEDSRSSTLTCLVDPYQKVSSQGVFLDCPIDIKVENFVDGCDFFYEVIPNLDVNETVEVEIEYSLE